MVLHLRHPTFLVLIIVILGEFQVGIRPDRSESVTDQNEEGESDSLRYRFRCPFLVKRKLWLKQIESSYNNNNYYTSINKAIPLVVYKYSTVER